MMLRATMAWSPLIPLLGPRPYTVSDHGSSWAFHTNSLLGRCKLVLSSGGHCGLAGNPEATGLPQSGSKTTVAILTPNAQHPLRTVLGGKTDSCRCSQSPAAVLMGKSKGSTAASGLKDFSRPSLCA